MKNGVFFRLALSIPKKSFAGWKKSKLREQREKIPGDYPHLDGDAILGGEVSVEGAKTLKAALATLESMGMELEKKDVEKWEKTTLDGKPHVRIETKGALKRDASVQQLLNYLEKQTESGEEHVQIALDGKTGTVELSGYLGGYDAYSSHFYPLLMLGAAASAHEGRGELVFLGDAELLDEAVFVRAIFSSEGVDLVVHDEPQDITEEQSQELEAGLGPGGETAIRAAHAEWIGRFIEKKRKRMFAGCIGFLRTDGSFAIEPRYRSAGGFWEGLAFVSEKGPFDYGYIDQKGELVIPYGFFSATDFKQGRALVKMETNRKELGEHSWQVTYAYGFIDQRGKWVVEPKYPHAEQFSEDRAVVATLEARGYVDLDGNEIVPPRYKHAIAFADGLALVAEHSRDEKGGFGFIDKQGKVAIPLALECAGTFYKGYAVASKGGLWGFLDPSGQFLFEPRFPQCGYLVDDRALAMLDGKWGVVDGKGNVIIPFEQARLRLYGEWFVAESQEGVTCFSQNGEKLFALPYNLVGEPRDGRGVISEPGHRGPFGYLDSSGKVVIEPRFQFAAPWSGDRAIVEDENGKWGIIDASGKMLTLFDFRLFPSASASYFAKNGLAYIESSNRYGLVNRDGRVIHPPEFSAMHGFGDDLVWVQYPANLD